MKRLLTAEIIQEDMQTCMKALEYLLENDLKTQHMLNQMNITESNNLEFFWSRMVTYIKTCADSLSNLAAYEGDITTIVFLGIAGEKIGNECLNIIVQASELYYTHKKKNPNQLRNYSIDKEVFKFETKK